MQILTLGILLLTVCDLFCPPTISLVSSILKYLYKSSWKWIVRVCSFILFKPAVYSIELFIERLENMLATASDAIYFLILVTKLFLTGAGLVARNSTARRQIFY